MRPSVLHLCARLALDTTCRNFRMSSSKARAMIAAVSRKWILWSTCSLSHCSLPKSPLLQHVRLVEPESQICALATREAGKVHLRLIKWGGRTQTVGNSSNIEGVIKRWKVATKTSAWKATKIQSSSDWQCLGSSPSQGTGWHTGLPRGSWRGDTWGLLADIIPGAPDCSRWQEVPAQASGWAFLQELTLNSCTGASCQTSRQAHLLRHSPFSGTVWKFNWHAVGKRTGLQGFLLCTC